MEIGEAAGRIGMIHLPVPDHLRKAVDITAELVARARNGVEFEIELMRLRQPRLHFLDPSDPYHPYYELARMEHKMSRLEHEQAQA